MSNCIMNCQNPQQEINIRKLKVVMFETKNCQIIQFWKKNDNVTLK